MNLAVLDTKMITIHFYLKYIYLNNEIIKGNLDCNQHKITKYKASLLARFICMRVNATVFTENLTVFAEKLSQFRNFPFILLVSHT